MRSAARWWIVLVMCLGFGATTASVAAEDGKDKGKGKDSKETVAQPETGDKPEDQKKAPSIQSSLGPFGDPGGYRAYLADRGFSYSLTYIGEVLGNSSGGLKRGTIYEGRLDAQFDFDLEKIFGWQGATIHSNIYQIHGPGLSRSFLGNLITASGIEALPSTRLYELWLEQKLLDGKVMIRGGQLAADTEFFVSDTAGVFVNATFGWPTITAVNLPSGGPAYPLATPAIRVKLQPTDDLSLMIGLFDGDPAGPQRTEFEPSNPQIRNRNGLEFRTRDPALLITEGAYKYSFGPKDTGLTGTVKLGYWHHFGRFDDQRYSDDGLSLASPLSSGVARRFRGNDGVYGVIDQSLYRVPGSDDRGIAAFLRVSASPDDLNLVGVYLDAGIAAKGMIPGREDDTLGIGFAIAQISDRTRGLDRDAQTIALLNGGGYAPVRSNEQLIEVSYQAQIVPGWTVQPDFQYVFRPSGGVINPYDPAGRTIKDAAIFGVRTTIRY